jgi:hypothetical protein
MLINFLPLNASIAILISLTRIRKVSSKVVTSSRVISRKAIAAVSVKVNLSIIIKTIKKTLILLTLHPCIHLRRQNSVYYRYA